MAQRLHWYGIEVKLVRRLSCPARDKRKVVIHKGGLSKPLICGTVVLAFLERVVSSLHNKFLPDDRSMLYSFSVEFGKASLISQRDRCA